MLQTVVDIFVLAVAVTAVANFLPGVRVKDFTTSLLVALVYSIIGALVKWFLVLISLPFLLVTLGLFMIVINAFLLWITDKILDDFEISSFGTTILASILISLINLVLRWTVSIVI